MINATQRLNPAAASVNEKLQGVNTPIQTGGAIENGHLSTKKDSHEASTAPKFSEISQEIQKKYGEKAAKPREIKKSLGKDDFLRIMMTQMKNQDPTNPFKAEQMAAEIAQFTSVEQLQNVNQNLNKMAMTNKPLEQMAMTQLIGKRVTIDRERFPHIEGEREELSFPLERDAGSVSIALMNDAGEVIFKKDLGKQSAGIVSTNWDGMALNAIASKTGTYHLKVDAQDLHGKKIEVQSQVQSQVLGVSFEGQEPILLVGNAKHPDKITMKNIVRIEMDLPIQSVKSLPELAQTSHQMTSRKPNTMEDRKEIVNSPALPTAANLGLKNEVALSSLLSGPEEKGFPNGLKEGIDEGVPLQEGAAQ